MNIFNSAQTVGQLLRQFAGATSLCWDAAGVFDSQMALSLSELAEERLIEIIHQQAVASAEGETVRNFCEKCEIPRDNTHLKLCPICLLDEGCWTGESSKAN